MLWVYLIHDGGYDCEDGFVAIQGVGLCGDFRQQTIDDRGA